MIAVSHPGKTGDAIYALPVTRYLCEKHGCQADFYSSSHVARCSDLIEYQSYINKFIVPESYVIQRYDMGIQPIEMPIPNQYEAIYHLGYRYVPDERLDWFIAKQIGVGREHLKPVSYEHPDYDMELTEKFYVLASSGPTGYMQTFIDFMKIANLPVVQVGLRDHYLDVQDTQSEMINKTGCTFLETCYLLSKSSGFVGLQTNQLVLANGFDIPRVSPHDGKSWDMRHVLPLPKSHYLVNPTAQEMLNALCR